MSNTSGTDPDNHGHDAPSASGTDQTGPHLRSAEHGGPGTVLFLCAQGGAKSVIAATWFNRLAAERSLPFQAISAAAEEPYEQVPPPLVAALRADGFEVSSFRPRRAAREDLADSIRVVAFDCVVPEALTEIERWDNISKVSEDLPAAVGDIRKRVERLFERLKPA